MSLSVFRWGDGRISFNRATALLSFSSAVAILVHVFEPVRATEKSIATLGVGDDIVTFPSSRLLFKSRSISCGRCMDADGEWRTGLFFPGLFSTGEGIGMRNRGSGMPWEPYL